LGAKVFLVEASLLNHLMQKMQQEALMLKKMMMMMMCLLVPFVEMPRGFGYRGLLQVWAALVEELE